MQGNPKVIAGLNQALCSELTAINQYFVHHAMVETMGYDKLASAMRADSIDEMKHAEELVERILFLDGVPNMQKYEKLKIGKTIPEMYEADLKLELEAIKNYQTMIGEFQAEGDYGSAELIIRILADEEKHADHLETQLQIIKEIGLQAYLTQQFSVGGGG